MADLATSRIQDRHMRMEIVTGYLRTCMESAGDTLQDVADAMGQHSSAACRGLSHLHMAGEFLNEMERLLVEEFQIIAVVREHEKIHNLIKEAS